MMIQVAHFTYTGVTEENLQSFLSLTEFAMRQPKIRLRYSRISGDALIERSRSRALSWILPDDGADVMVMVDHDIEFQPEDLYGLAIKALETDGLVAGVYSLRGLKKGWACRFAAREHVEVGKDVLFPATYLGTGFLAIPRNVAIRLVDAFGKPDVDPDMKITKCKDDWSHEAHGVPYFHDFFRCMPMPISVEGHSGEYEFLSEDWAFCARAAKIGVPMHVWAKPILKHWGMHGFTQKEGEFA